MRRKLSDRPRKDCSPGTCTGPAARPPAQPRHVPGGGGQLLRPPGPGLPPRPVLRGAEPRGLITQGVAEGLGQGLLGCPQRGEVVVRAGRREAPPWAGHRATDEVKMSTSVRAGGLRGTSARPSPAPGPVLRSSSTSNTADAEPPTWAITTLVPVRERQRSTPGGHRSPPRKERRLCPIVLGRNPYRNYANNEIMHREITVDIYWFNGCAPIALFRSSFSLL